MWDGVDDRLRPYSEETNRMLIRWMEVDRSSPNSLRSSSQLVQTSLSIASHLPLFWAPVCLIASLGHEAP